MLMRNENAIMVAEPDLADARHVERLLQQMGHLVRLGFSARQVLELLRRELIDRAVVAVELTVAGEPLLARLGRLPMLRQVVATGPPDRPEMERLARASGADVYFPRPVEASALAMAFGVQVSPQRLAHPP